MPDQPQELLIDEAGADLVAETLASFGGVRLRARGSSMFPAIRAGDILDIVRTRAGSLRPGDVILARRGRRVIAHRVLSIRGDAAAATVVTRGDALRRPEVWREDEVLGRVETVIRNGAPARTPVCPPLQHAIGIAASHAVVARAWLARALRPTRRRTAAG